jgi:hypothetical protein
MKLHGKQQTTDTLQVRELLEKRVYLPTADYGEKIPGCEVTLEDVQGIPGCMATPENIRTKEDMGCKATHDDAARWDVVKQYSPGKTMTDHCLHVNDLQLTNWQGHKIGDVTQVLDLCEH